MNRVDQFIGTSLVRADLANVWRGLYRDAQERQFRHLKDECPICLTEYLPEARVLVLPCTHGYHEACFNGWQRQVCIYNDQLEAVRVNLLGRSLLVPLNVQLTFQQLVEQLEIHFKNFLRTLTNQSKENLGKIWDDPEGRAKFEAVADSLVAVLQGALDAYEGRISIHNTREEVQRIFGRFLSCTRELKLPHELEQKDLEGAINVLKGFNFVVGCLLLGVLNGIHARRQMLDEDLVAVTRVNLYIGEIFMSLDQGPNLDTLIEDYTKEWDRRFLLKHLGAIRRLDSDVAKYGYLLKLDWTPGNALLGFKDSLGHLQKLTKDLRGPASQWIQEATRKISLVKKGLAGGVVMLTTGAVALVVFKAFNSSDSN